MPKKVKKESAPQKSTPQSSTLGRVIRGVIGLAILGAILLFVGSVIIRESAIKRQYLRMVTETSLVYSKPTPISPGISLENISLETRLKRLGFHPTSGIPKYPGQYFKSSNEWLIFFRKTLLPTGVKQDELLVQLHTAENSEVIGINNVVKNLALSHVWLEPEIISLLGNTATRASTPKKLGDFPKNLTNAIISIEDERFYDHFGVDPIGIGRAMISNLQAGKIVQGGSTLTQQLAKSLYFSQERTISRKILEVFVAVLLETAFSKNDILEFYLNEIFLGQEGNVAIHGFGEASLSFFGKDVSELTLAEAALLAGLAKAPSSYSPRNNPERAITRRNVVLQRMYELNKITATELKQAKAITFSLSPARRQRRTAPYFVDYIRANLLDYYDDRYLPNKPLHIYTSIDTQYQLCANKAVSAGLTEIENSRPKLKKHKSSLQAALIAVTPADANIIAWVGGRNYQKNQFDRVSQAKRQPGSSFKPFVYLTALDNLLNQYRTARTTSLLEDEPIVLKIPGSTNWEPQNYDHKFRGEVTLREALVHSLNVPTVNLAIKVGIDSIARTGELFGFGSNLPRVPSLALGAGEVSPLSMARAYNAIANGGMLTDLLPIIAVSNAQDGSIVSKPRANSHRAASEAATFVLTDILRSAIDRGTGQTVRRLGFTNPAAGKTGTTNDSRDSWFVGFTPRLLAVVWVGFDDNSEHGLTGASGAAPIWTKFMKCVEDMEPKIDFVPPPGVVYRDIDISTGLLATSSCPRDLVTREIFVSGYEPITDCTAHSGGFSIFRRSEEPKEEPRDRRKKKEDFLDKIWDSLF